MRSQRVSDVLYSAEQADELDETSSTQNIEEEKEQRRRVKALKSLQESRKEELEKLRKRVTDTYIQFPKLAPELNQHDPNGEPAPSQLLMNLQDAALHIFTQDLSITPEDMSSHALRPYRDCRPITICFCCFISEVPQLSRSSQQSRATTSRSAATDQGSSSQDQVSSLSQPNFYPLVIPSWYSLGIQLLREHENMHAL